MSRAKFAFEPHIHTVLQSPRPPAISELSYRGLQDELPCSTSRLGSPPGKNPCTPATMAWMALPDGSVDFVSRSWLEYMGFSLEDCLDGWWSTVAHPEDLDRTAQKWQAALVTGEPYECEVRTRTASGSYRWCLSRAVPLRDEVGKIVKWLGTNTDIDERKKTEEKLQESEAYLAEAQRLRHTGSWAWIPATGDIRYWSEECDRALGFDFD